jgi:hypothetical protein
MKNVRCIYEKRVCKNDSYAIPYCHGVCSLMYLGNLWYV